MTIKKLFIFCVSVVYFQCTLTALYAEEIIYPDISGDWHSISESGERTTAKVNLVQSGKDITGNFIDEKDGKILVDARLVGYIDQAGNVIFDIYFGKVTSTNRLTLSPDSKTLTGTFTNTIGNNGNVHYAK